MSYIFFQIGNWITAYRSK